MNNNNNNNNRKGAKAKPKVKRSLGPNRSSVGPTMQRLRIAKAQQASVLKSAPVAKARVRGIAEPRFERSSSNGDITVEHEEYVQDVNGSVAFANTGIQVNPGLTASFPWLAQMAPLYESYRFEKLEYCFESMSSTSSTGTIMMAVDYDASDPLAASKSGLAPYRGFVRSAPWLECSCESVREDLNKRASYYVRVGPLGSNQDIKLYDVGLLNLATQGQADTSVIGELYVRYRVRFMTPQLLQNGVGASQSMRVSATSEGGALTVTGNAPLNVTGTGGVITLTATAPYQGEVSYKGTGTTTTAISTAGSTATITVAPAAVVDGGSTNIAGALVVNWAAPGQTLVVDLGTAAATLTAVNLRIGQYANSLN